MAEAGREHRKKINGSDDNPVLPRALRLSDHRPFSTCHPVYKHTADDEDDDGTHKSEAKRIEIAAGPMFLRQCTGSPQNRRCRDKQDHQPGHSQPIAG